MNLTEAGVFQAASYISRWALAPVLVTQTGASALRLIRHKRLAAA